MTSDELRNHIAAEASWLRALVEGTPAQENGGLAARLRDLVRKAASEGVLVELNDAQLQASPRGGNVPPGVSAAVVGAAREALTNVVKHAQVSQATLRVIITGDRLIVSIVDQGCGFDPGQAHWRTGLRQSITGRVTEAGGTVKIDSAPGCGTRIELNVPAPVMEEASSGD